MLANWGHEKHRGRRRAVALVVVLHGCLLLAVMQLRPPPLPAPDGELASIEIVPVTLPKPPVRKIDDDTSAGVKVARRPSVGVPTAKTRERQLKTLPRFDFKPELSETAVADPRPNLSAFDAIPTVIGTGGTGKSGTGAGAAGNGRGTGKKAGLFTDCADTPERAMVADVYQLARDTSTVTAIHARRPVKRVCLAQLNITPRPYRQGIEGVDRVEWFGLDIRFTVNLPEEATWDLLLLSDDGAILTIDDVEIIDHDGVHGASALTAQVKLAKGARNFRVRYYQGPGGEIALMLAWKKPGDAEFDYMPLDLIGRPAPGLLTALTPAQGKIPAQ